MPYLLTYHIRPYARPHQNLLDSKSYVKVIVSKMPHLYAVVTSEIKLTQKNAKQCFVSVKLFCFSFVSACLHVKQNAKTKQK